MGEQMMATPVMYQFLDVRQLVGDPMETAHLANPHAITVEWRGGGQWAVLLGSGWRPQRVWCEEDGDWEYEPLPSEREEDFLRRTRYDHDTALSIGARLALESTDD